MNMNTRMTTSMRIRTSMTTQTATSTRITTKTRKYVQNRLARASGHLQHVRAMVDSGEDCSDVLMQLSAVIGALQSIAKVILKDHLDHCVVDAVQSGDTQTLDDFKKAIDRYIR